MIPSRTDKDRTFSPRGEALGVGMIWSYVACIVALAAISSQWWENRQLREELRLTSLLQSKALHKQAEVIEEMQSRRHEERRLIEQSCRTQVRWAAEMRDAFASLNETQGQSQIKAQQLSEERRFNQWNAQSIVSIFNSAASAGVNWKGKSRDKLVEEVLVGMSPATGPFAGKTFRVPNFTLEEAFLCTPFIALDADKGLVYDQSGGQPPPDPDSSLASQAARKTAVQSSAHSLFPPMPGT